MAGHHHNYPAWRWAVLFSFSCNCAGNSFMFMDFTTLEDIAKEALNLDLASDASEQLIAWTYSASLLAGKKFGAN